MQIKIEDIIVLKDFNVRDELGSLSDLVDSIKETKGVLNPLLVCKIPNSEKYELLAGERRLNAAKEAKFKTIECIIRDASNEYEKFQVMYHENIGRKDLTWAEKAKATKLLLNIAKRFNKVDALQEVSEKQDKSTRTTFRYLNAAKVIEEFPVLENEKSLSAAIGKYKKIKDLDVRTQEKLKNNELSLKQAVYVEKKNRVQRETDTGNLVIEELQKEIHHYKSNILELAKQKNKEERIPIGVLLIDEVKVIVEAARSCEAFGIKDIQKDACSECESKSPNIKQVCDWWHESVK